MPLFGDKADFAVEYTLTDPYPPYGHLRLWVGGLPLGDFTEAMHLYHALITLGACAVRNPKFDRAKCDSIAEMPDRETALRDSDLSLGEAHDYYELAIYTINDIRCLCFLWREYKFRQSPLESERRINEAIVSWDRYDRVVLSAIGAIETQIFEESGRHLSFG